MQALSRKQPGRQPPPPFPLLLPVLYGSELQHLAGTDRIAAFHGFGQEEDLPLNIRGDVFNTRRLFKGEGIAVDTDGPFLTARAVNAGNLFERKLPRWLLQPTCNWALFDSACGLDRAAWRVDGQIVDAYTSNTFRLRVRLSGGSGIAENFFAGGWLETAKDNVLGTRGISGSTAPNAANEVELMISSDLQPWPANNQPISLYPGCDGRRETCLNRFRNYPRFGGFPFMPVGNPSMIKMPANRNIK